MDKCGQALRPVLSEVLSAKAGAQCGLTQSKEVGDFTLVRKAAKCFRCPYRKPTQVDEEKILR